MTGSSPVCVGEMPDAQVVFGLFEPDRSEWGGRQNARPRVRFDKIFASFSSNGKGRASPA